MKRIFMLGLLLNFTGKLVECVHLSVSSVPPDKIEINWERNDDIQSVALYDKNPEEDLTLKPLTVIDVAEHPGRHGKTNLTYNPEPFPGNWSRGSSEPKNLDEDLCLYWLLVKFSDESQKVVCHKIRPAWMHRNKMKLKHLSLPQMFIPGTHNSGTDAVKATKQGTLGFLDNFVLTQDRSIWDQLVYGIRFLDLRIGYYPQEVDLNRRFWINHDLLPIQPLLPVLKDIVRFSQSSPDEVIILDFHRFPAGFRGRNTTIIHQELIKLIGNELEKSAIPRPFNQAKLKLEEIWNSDKRLVISYSDQVSVDETPWLWNSVSQKWGNKQLPKDLEHYLDNILRDAIPTRLWAAMAELTPTPIQFLSNVSLRSLADRVNRLLGKWFTERKNWANKANIVAQDFFLGTNLIDIAIDENLRKASDMESV